MALSDRLYSAMRRMGRPVTIRRNTLTNGVVAVGWEATIYAVTRNYAPHEIVTGSGIVQGDTEVTFSGKDLGAEQYPVPPKKGDFILFDGRNAVVQAVEPKYLGADLLVYAAQVRG